MIDWLVRASIIAPPLLVAVILHEIAHALVAEKLGDPTARRLGRISLNPLRHIDPYMTLLVPGLLIASGSPIVFGGAKPVPVDARYFAHPRRDMGIVAVAGPISNIIIALISFALYLLAQKVLGAEGLIPEYVINVLALSVIINIVLCCFNLVPVPPLDGGRIAVALLPRRLARVWARLEPFGLLIVVALLLSGAVEKILAPIIDVTVKLLG